MELCRDISNDLFHGIHSEKSLGVTALFKVIRLSFRIPNCGFVKTYIRLISHCTVQLYNA